MGLVLVARPIVSFYQTTDLFFWYLSHKGSAKSNSSILNIITLLDEGLEVGLESYISIFWWPTVVTPISPPMNYSSSSALYTSAGEQILPKNLLNPAEWVIIVSKWIKSVEMFFRKKNLYNKHPCIQHYNFIDIFASPSPFKTWCFKRGFKNFQPPNSFWEERPCLLAGGI